MLRKLAGTGLVSGYRHELVKVAACSLASKELLGLRPAMLGHLNIPFLVDKPDCQAPSHSDYSLTKYWALT